MMRLNQNTLHWNTIIILLLSLVSLDFIPVSTQQANGDSRNRVFSRRLEISTSYDSLIADSSDSVVVEARILDTDGMLLIEDDTSRVQFALARTQGTLSDYSQVVKDGIAKVTMRSRSSGVIGVTAYTPESRKAKVSIVSVTKVGPIALDLNPQFGYQDQRVLEESDQTPAGLFEVGNIISVDLVAISGVAQAQGFEINLQFDDTLLRFVQFEAKDLVTQNALVDTNTSDGLLKIAVTEQDLIQSNSGSLGLLSFEVLQEGLLTKIKLVNANLLFSTGLSHLELILAGTELMVGNRVARIFPPFVPGDVVYLILPEGMTPFIVDFEDFIGFVEAFGSCEGDPKYNIWADTDSDGVISFSDYISFAGSFGKVLIQ